jgi:hypothetical protein
VQRAAVRPDRANRAPPGKPPHPARVGGVTP